MSSHYELLLAADTRATVAPMEVFSPYSGATLATIDRCSASQVEASLAAAHGLFRINLPGSRLNSVARYWRKLRRSCRRALTNWRKVRRRRVASR